MANAIPEGLHIDPEALARSGATHDRVRFWRDARYNGLECLVATFRDHRYAPHTHDTYVVGVIEGGCESYRLRGVRHYAAAGELCFVNPGEVHDGEPVGGAYTYRMTYPTVDLFRAISEDIFGHRAASTPVFAHGVARDPKGYRLFSQAHRRLEAGGDRLAADQALLETYAYLIARHSSHARALAPAGNEQRRVADMCAYLDAHHAESVALADVARVAGLGPHHALRVFRKALGITPHAFLTDIRVRAAARLLRDGATPGDAATACGFCDQSHLTRAFKARTGVTPRAFAVG
jgi:AraC-like DNA-binding protein